jgi:hypothetical protein
MFLMFSIWLGLPPAFAGQTPPAKPSAKPEAKPKPAPDVLVLNDGETLMGHFVRSSATAVTFHSDMLGDVTTDWAKVKELKTSGRYAVVRKNVPINRHTDEKGIPRGALAVADQKLTVTPAAPAQAETVPVADAAHVVDVAELDKAIYHEPGFFEAWKGAVTAGAALVEATQESRTFTGSFNLVRAIPTENWIDARDRTAVDFNAADGLVSQPGSANVKTQIVHFDAERDEYFTSSKGYVFVQGAFDHNFSQGLRLRQTYGGGVGRTVVKKANETLDFKVSASYLRQGFLASTVGGNPSLNQNLVASTFAENYTKKFGKGNQIVFLEQLTATPTWNNLDASMSSARASLTVPLYKRLGFTTGATDSFLNNPPSGFRKNSFQFATGLTYTVQ